MTPIRTAVAAAESTVRSRLRAWLRPEPDFHWVGEAPDGPAALRLIVRTAPDLLILHVDLPDLDGFGVVGALAEAALAPAVIFVAEGPKAAVRAFEVHAIDYLQLPFDAPRLRRSLERARQQLQGRRRFRPLETLAAAASGTRLAVPIERRTVFLDLENLHWVKAAGRRTELHLRDGVRVADVPFGTLHRRLPSATYLQINRSVIVRRDFIREIRRRTHGTRWVIFQSGEQSVLTRTRRRSVLGRL